MPRTTPTRELYPKAVFNREQVEAEAVRRRRHLGVVSVTVEDGGSDWVLVTQREVF